MPAAVIAPFKAAPNQTSNLTSGWTSKVLYSFQAAADIAPVVSSDADVFTTLASFADGQKGSINFLGNYFRTPSINSGRTIKITMYFQVNRENENVSFFTGLFSSGGKDLIEPTLVGQTDSDGGPSICRYESFINVYDFDGGVWLQVDGSIIFPYNNSFITKATMFSAKRSLTGGYIPYSLYLENRCNIDTPILSVLVEEIG